MMPGKSFLTQSRRFALQNMSLVLSHCSGLFFYRAVTVGAGCRVITRCVTLQLVAFCLVREIEGRAGVSGIICFVSWKQASSDLPLRWQIAARRFFFSQVSRSIFASCGRGVVVNTFINLIVCSFWIHSNRNRSSAGVQPSLAYHKFIFTLQIALSRGSGNNTPFKIKKN